MHPGQMGGGFDDDPTSPHAGPPHLMPGMQPNFPPYAYRFQVSCDTIMSTKLIPQQGMPQHGMQPQMNNGMFSPGPGYSQLPGGPMQSPGHMGGPPPNGMPLHFYQNGMPRKWRPFHHGL